MLHFGDDVLRFDKHLFFLSDRYYLFPLLGFHRDRVLICFECCAAYVCSHASNLARTVRLNDGSTCNGFCNRLGGGKVADFDSAIGDGSEDGIEESSEDNGDAGIDVDCAATGRTWFGTSPSGLV